MTENPATFGDSKVQYYSQIVYSKFHNFSFNLGKISCNYSDWDKGYQLQQIYVPSVDEGRKVIEQILDIQGHSFEWELLRYNAAPNPNIAFPEIPEKVVVGGASIRTEQFRPLGSVTFSQALIHFPHTKNYEVLCDNSGYLLKSVAFLRALED